MKSINEVRTKKNKNRVNSNTTTNKSKFLSPEFADFQQLRSTWIFNTKAMIINVNWDIHLNLN